MEVTGLRGEDEGQGSARVRAGFGQRRAARHRCPACAAAQAQQHSKAPPKALTNASTKTTPLRGSAAPAAQPAPSSTAQGPGRLTRLSADCPGPGWAAGGQPAGKAVRTTSCSAQGAPTSVSH